MKKYLSAAGLSLGLFCTTTPVLAEPSLNIVTSIKPLHSLVSMVAGETANQHLMIKGAGSPHDYHLKPSDAKALQGADLVVWVGPTLETFLDKPIDTAPATTQVLRLDSVLMGDEKHDDHDEHDDHAHEKHGHDDHGHDKHAHDAHGHDDHDHKMHKDDHHDHHEAHHDTHHEKHEEEHHDTHHDDHDDHAGHNHDGPDPHIWMNPKLAMKAIHEIEEALIAKDPAHKAVYEKNAAAALKELDHLHHEIEELLHPVHEKPFIVFHDGYGHLAKAFDLHISGALTLSPEQTPGARRLSEIRKKINHDKVACVFAEPQFQPKMVQTVIEGTSAKAGVLDPLGFDIPAGPKMYETLMMNMARSLKNCLSS